MSAVTVADVRAVHRVRLQDVDQVPMQWAMRLEDFELRKSDPSIPLYGVKPGLLFAQLFFGWPCYSRFRIFGPLQGFVICELRQREVVSNCFLPNLTPEFGCYSPPPKLPSPGLSNDLIPIRKYMFLPYTKKGTFGVVFGALRIGDFGSPFPF